MGDPIIGDVEEEILRRFAAAVILQAMRDAVGRRGINYKQIAEARAWLLDEGNKFPWFELARVQRRYILAWFEAGCKDPKEFSIGMDYKERYKRFPEKKYSYGYELKTEPPGEKAPIDPDLGIDY